MINRHIGFQSILAVFLLFVFSGMVSAEAPPIINYEGTLADTEGNPVPDGNYEIRFGIYSVLTGGTPLWSERWDFSSSPIAVRNGKFNVLLGSHSPFPEDLFGDLTVAYLGIRVGNDVEMQPRQRIASVPYALNCNSASEGGWIEADETWQFAGADDPEFTFIAAGNQTGKYSAGMKARCVQSSTVKYFIITKVAYAAPNTTVTVFGGTDYNLDNAPISDPVYSIVKSPQGFPLRKDKWTLQVKDTTYRTTTTNDVWIHLAPATLRVPTGDWTIMYDVCMAAQAGGGGDDPRTGMASVTLAKSPATEDDFDFRGFVIMRAADVKEIRGSPNMHREKSLYLDAPATFYLNVYYHEPKGGRTLYLLNNASPMIIRAVCNYL